MRVLVAEDDPVSLEMLIAMLEWWGYESVCVSDGASALDALKQDDSISLALLDWMMPGLDGVEVCRNYRKDEPAGYRKYLLLLTVRSSDEDVVAAFQSGADDHIKKPFCAEELRARLEVGRKMIELQKALKQRIADLEDALAHVKTLQGILPVCSHCHRIRTDKQSWEQIELYIEAHTEALFSHGLCPDCYDRYYLKELGRLPKDREK
ncbi:MAG TPA: response regulator transcription factor [Candidatus Sumerlaeota bacterium]|nr:response regulator transcription factor [Candidatus Sumerlaeota bacterium]HPS00306.1 response regulator transcription factor [Candidatus Sumerlaeota bacterium]